ncbi:uncharacterized protein PHACADRAFT_255217 [Phanerochaete carnosa HHB-10118-sp]|uniref:Cytochrome P450 n=1 Tax=Phanerochaete carnosa (strain HHB-10118-sp) TaxID=650164 RepID=K5WWW8_PHACS|nr:uncharacterized protein PHACADRAFT_255217 [Phanerochaete carnosa HHB-10118-sp]EKM54962.1 hypothetical protein PHACADRAFT_255217 [Phanerochaete carnosa HHB-10118-sp]
MSLPTRSTDGGAKSSDIVRINVLGTNIVVTNTLEASADLLDKRSLIYSNRPTHGLTMMRDLCGFDWAVAFAQPGKYWREQRKVYQREYHPQAIKRYRRTETQAAHTFLHNLLASPEDFFRHTRYVLGQVLIYSAYGVKTKNHDDPLIATVEHGVEAAVAAMSPGQFLVDILPIMKYIPAWFPGAEFQRKAKVWRKSVHKLLHVPFTLAKNLQDASELPDDCAAKSFLADVIPSSADPTYMEYVVRSALAGAYSAGTDTTVSVLQSFFLAMTLYPDVQKEAQREIDSVCRGRLPDFSDYDALPYVHAIVKEILRWNPAVPLNIVHASAQDDVYRGYCIPKGSLVVANIWAILHDPAVYADPESFCPSRFLRSDTNPTPEPDPDAAYGFGRRICAGQYLAHEMLWITIASVVAAFDIVKAKDEAGREIVPPGEYHYGFMQLPKPFRCEIRPRSVEHEKLVLGAVDL